MDFLLFYRLNLFFDEIFHYNTIFIENAYKVHARRII